MPFVKQITTQWSESAEIFGGSSIPTPAYITHEDGMGNAEPQEQDVIRTETQSSGYTGKLIGIMQNDPDTGDQILISEDEG
ncbi:hypothetical protein [Ekhidna sp. To15]|uniref:hypothetical protein n=1 Tax=Ekhidna sp. To15 TaxID=3395267 RepID=UPI003F526C4E